MHKRYKDLGTSEMSVTLSLKTVVIKVYAYIPSLNLLIDTKKRFIKIFGDVQNKFNLYACCSNHIKMAMHMCETEHRRAKAISFFISFFDTVFLQANGTGDTIARRHGIGLEHVKVESE